MKFHEWRNGNSFFHTLKIKPPRSLFELVTMGQGIKEFLERSPHISNVEKTTNMCCFMGVGGWYLDKRPYYNVYPKVVDALLKTKLDIPMSSLKLPFEYSSLLVRLAEGHEIANGEVGAVFISCPEPIDESDTTRRISIQAWKVGGDKYTHHFVVTCLNSDLICDAITREVQSVEAPEGEPMRILSQDLVTECMKLALGVSLLEHNAELIVPEVLNDDASKLETADEATIKRLQDKAIRRGKHGWSVGACTEPRPGYEMPAHYRRPHFSIRWTGVGRTIPKLCHIRGSIVHRDKITEIPTGYLDKQGGYEKTENQTS